ncbi:hypothetical protein [Lacibacter sp. H407]|uniref:hypothetical protein n=1 Tax=Lacibacter sp. H407 TaxID=3133423 RepID=UPI0030BA7AB6
MVSNYLFFIEQPIEFLLSEHKKEKKEYIFPITKDLLSDKAFLFKKLYNSETRFCFCITKDILNPSVITKEYLVSFLVLFAFLPNYARYRQNYLFFFDEEVSSEREFRRQKEELLNTLRLQGIKNIITTDLDKKKRVVNADKKSLCITNEAFSQYITSSDKGIVSQDLIKKIISPDSIEKKWIIHIESSSDYTTKNQLADHFSSLVSQINPVVFKLLSLYENADDLKAKFEFEKSALQIKLDNTNDNLKVLRNNSLWYVYEYDKVIREIDHLRRHVENNGSTPAFVHVEAPIIANDFNQNSFELKTRLDEVVKNRDTILEWYMKEYEVLPVWYKRVGHLIKAATGKRTFKSLFTK